jgi:hypothetical protein
MLNDDAEREGERRTLATLLLSWIVWRSWIDGTSWLVLSRLRASRPAVATRRARIVAAPVESMRRWRRITVCVLGATPSQGTDEQLDRAPADHDARQVALWTGASRRDVVEPPGRIASRRPPSLSAARDLLARVLASKARDAVARHHALALARGSSRSERSGSCEFEAKCRAARRSVDLPEQRDHLP